MIKLSEDEKKFIKELNHPTYTAEWVEEWANRYERLKERDRAKPAENKILLEGGRLYIGDCPSCGLGITQANFCGNCGQRIDWSKESEA